MGSAGVCCPYLIYINHYPQNPLSVFVSFFPAISSALVALVMFRMLCLYMAWLGSSALIVPSFWFRRRACKVSFSAPDQVTDNCADKKTQATGYGYWRG